jgi:hypothetical protein
MSKISKSIRRDLMRFFDLIEAEADRRGIMAATLVQYACGGPRGRWSSWQDGKNMPTVRTIEKVEAYIAEGKTGRA